MPIDTLHDLTDLSSTELYVVYLAIARADHRWRVRTLYGDAERPAGHTEFRPLSNEQFEARLEVAKTLTNGESMFRQRLSRQAAAYRVDVGDELYRLRPAA